jgi:hypothetical protein
MPLIGVLATSIGAIGFNWSAPKNLKLMRYGERIGFYLDIPVLGGYAGVTAPGAVYGVTVRFFH